MKKWNKERFATIWEKLESMIALRSLRARIFLLTLVIGLVPCIAMRHGIVSNYEDLAVEQRTTVVQNQLMILANHLISNNYLSSHGVREDTGNSREVINAELEMLSNLYEGRVMIINKNFKVEKDTYGISEGKTIISEEVIKCFQGENISHYDPEHGYIEMTTPIMDTTANTTDENGKRNPDAIRGVMLTSISNDSIVNAKEVLNRKAYILEVIMMVAILALAIILSRALTRPFNRVTQAINAVKEGFSDETISVPDYVETVHIVDAFNQLLKRMKALDDSRQAFYYERYGAWYEKYGAYIHALSAYRRNQNFAAILRVVQKDAGILLASLKPEEVLEVLNRCPVSVLKEYPLAILVLMRCMFNWKNIPKMLELKELLLASIREHPKLSEEERGNLLGECDLIQSFLMYNDISRMSQFHRSASEKMTRPAISIRSDGGWTFGSPSVLMMFHRKSGDLDKELEEMNQCMPHYYKITNGHGQGAETIMSAEAHFMRGNFVDAHIALEKAYTQIQGNGQESIALCCDFLAQRLSICMDIKMRNTFEERRKELLQGHNTTWVNIFDSTCAYYYAVTGQTERIPALFGAHMLSTVNFLAPGRPMMEMIENQVYLAQGEYSKVIGRSESILAMCQALHYDLVALHVQIQLLAANWKLGKTEQALELLRGSLSQAFPDGILMPFVENYPYIEELLKGSFFGINENFLFRITRMGKEWEMRCDQLKKEEAYPPVFKVLSDRELEITELMAKHMSNKEIAQSLFLSEGTVKQYINQIYSKLQIPGDVRVKRKYLLEMMEGKS